jgi:hypothetical protein
VQVFPREHFIMEEEGEDDELIKKVRYSTVN